MGRTLSDDEAVDRLVRAADALGEEPGETARAQTALTVARSAMRMLILGLEQASAEETDDVPGVLPQPHEP